MSVLVLLGPQRLRPTLATVVENLGIEGPIAAVTAGWQEREAEDDELAEHLWGRTVNLRLHRRAEIVFEEDPEFHQAWRQRQERLRALQRVYRLRLDHTLASVWELMRRVDEAAEILQPERDSALEALRKLDAEHLGRIRQVHEEFDSAWQPATRSSVLRQRRQIGRVLRQCEALAIAGGHVAVLLNRLRLFGLPRPRKPLPILAWSAGAMVMASRIVLFHDSPPQGAGNAEVFESGLGLCREFLPLPHARHRLRLEDPIRVEVFARRFAPRVSLTLDEGARLILVGDRWRAEEGVRRLTPSGRVVPME